MQEWIGIDFHSDWRQFRFATAISSSVAQFLSTKGFLFAFFVFEIVRLGFFTDRRRRFRSVASSCHCIELFWPVSHGHCLQA